MLGIDGVHGLIVLDPSEEDAHRDHVVEAEGRRPEHGGGVREHLLRLRNDAARHQLAGCWILADLAIQIDEAIDFDCLGKGADRRSQFRRRNCDLAQVYSPEQPGA